MARNDRGFEGAKLTHSAPYGPITAVRKILRRGPLEKQDADIEGALAMDGDPFEIASEIADSE